MWNHNSDVDASEKVANLINRLQRNTYFSVCTGQFGDSPEVPLFSDSKASCFNSSPGKPKEKINCGRSPTPKHDNKTRLCYCHARKRKHTTK